MELKNFFIIQVVLSSKYSWSHNIVQSYDRLSPKSRPISKLQPLQHPYGHYDWWGCLSTPLTHLSPSLLLHQDPVGHGASHHMPVAHHTLIFWRSPNFMLERRPGHMSLPHSNLQEAAVIFSMSVIPMTKGQTTQFFCLNVSAQ